MRNKEIEKLESYLDGVGMYTSYNIMEYYYNDNKENKKALNEFLGLENGYKELEIECDVSSSFKEEVEKAFSQLSNEVLIKSETYQKRRIVYLLDAQKVNANLTIKDDIVMYVSRILSDVGYKTRLSKGMKFSKFWAKLAREIGISEDIINDFLTKMSKITKATNTKETIIISTRPYDILTMSDGNSWSSCHRMEIDNEHEYKCGTLSYIMDEQSFIIYKPHRDGDNVKEWRYLAHYQDGGIGVCGAYPRENTHRDNAIIEALKKMTGLVECKAGDKDQNLGFSDGLSFALGKNETDTVEVYLPNSEYYALDTGNFISHSNFYCYDDVFYCEYCESWHSGESTEIETRRHDWVVCDDCLDEYFTWCSVCKKWHRNYDFNEDYNMCDDCVEDNFEYCTECGVFEHIDELQDGLCYSCHEELESEEE